MRCLVVAGALALAGCKAADQAAERTGNAAEVLGNTAAATSEAVGNAVEGGVESVANAIAADDPVNRDAWIGRWNGVEGTYLVVSKGDAPARYRLEMQYTLDDKGSFDGRGTDTGIAFTRPDGDQVLSASDGDATGLKYLAGKKDCLTVKSGEGYCRD